MLFLLLYICILFFRFAFYFYSSLDPAKQYPGVHSSYFFTYNSSNMFGCSPYWDVSQKGVIKDRFDFVKQGKAVISSTTPPLVLTIDYNCSNPLARCLKPGKYMKAKGAMESTCSWNIFKIFLLLLFQLVLFLHRLVLLLFFSNTLFQLVLVISLSFLLFFSKHPKTSSFFNVIIIYIWTLFF